MCFNWLEVLIPAGFVIKTYNPRALSCEICNSVKAIDGVLNLDPSSHIFTWSSPKCWCRGDFGLVYLSCHSNYWLPAIGVWRDDSDEQRFNSPISTPVESFRYHSALGRICCNASSSRALVSGSRDSRRCCSWLRVGKFSATHFLPACHTGNSDRRVFSVLVAAGFA